MLSVHYSFIYSYDVLTSDDPAYFKGYVNQNFINLHENLPITEEDVITLVKNSFKSAFISDELKEDYLARVDAVLQ